MIKFKRLLKKIIEEQNWNRIMPGNLRRQVVRTNRQTKVRNLFLKILYKILKTLKKLKKERARRFQDPYIGEFLNERYQVVKKIGKGSFGSVYLVDDTKIDIK